MNEFDIAKTKIAREEMMDSVDFINDFVGETTEFSKRLAGSESETACARAIRNRLHDESGVKTRLEAYYAYPLLGRGSLPLLGLWWMLSLALYFVSFAGGRVGGALLTALALVVFLSGSAGILSLFFGDKTLKGLLVKKASYNVVSEFSKNEGKAAKRTFVIADNHDAKLGGFFGDFGILRKLTILIAPISAFLFVLFCILKMAVGFDTIPKITAFTILPALFGILGAVVTFTHYSPFARHARENNGVATSVAMATYTYFATHKNRVPDDAKIIYVSLGGENAAHSGSQAFLKAHPELKDAKVLCVQDVLSGDFRIAECDPIRKINYSTPLVSIIRSSAHEQGIDVSVVPHENIVKQISSLHGYMSSAFAKDGIETATIVASGEADHVLDRQDIEKLFALTVGSLDKLMHETAKPSDNQPASQEPVSTDMEIKDVIGK